MIPEPEMEEDDDGSPSAKEPGGGVRTLVLTEADSRERVDKILAREWGESRARIRAWLDAGVVRAGERVLAGKEKLPAGTGILAVPPPVMPSTLEPEPMDLDILFEDAELVVLNKPSGLVVHPGAGQWTGTLVSGLLHHCAGQLSGIGGVERPGIVHRLDRDTSGVLVVAKTDRAHQGLAAQFKDRVTRKTYAAFLLGVPRHRLGVWQEPIGRHSQQRQKMAVRADGRTARTDYRVEATWTRCCRVRIDLHTGRTHQIRVHASHAGHAVVGDTVYGRQPAWVAEAGVRRHLLHAWKLEFQHPRTHKTLSLEAPLPEDFQRFEAFLKTP